MSRLTKAQVAERIPDCVGLDLLDYAAMDCDTNRYLKIPGDVTRAVTEAPYYEAMSTVAVNSKLLDFNKNPESGDYVNMWQSIINAGLSVFTSECYDQQEACGDREKYVPGYMEPPIPIIPYISPIDPVIPAVTMCFDSTDISDVVIDPESGEMYYIERQIETCLDNDTGSFGQRDKAVPKKRVITTADNCEEEECEEKQHWDENQQQCVDDNCGDDEHWDKKESKCVDNDCKEGRSWDYQIGGCVPDKLPEEENVDDYPEETFDVIKNGSNAEFKEYITNQLSEDL